MPPGDPYAHFGFYHDRSRTAAKVRNVVLTGELAGALPAQQLPNLLARDDDKRTAADLYSRPITDREVLSLQAEAIVNNGRGAAQGRAYIRS